MRVAKCHPQLGWLRLQARDYSRSLDHLLNFRDRDPDQNRTGPSPEYINWMWSVELPELMQRPEVRVFAQERIAELKAKSAELRKAIQRQVGSMEAEAEAAEQEAARINAVMQGLES